MKPMVCRRVTLMAVAVALGASWARAESAGAKNREGNRLFHQGQYVEAEKAYLQAQAVAPGRPELQYNLGNALLKQRKYEAALQALRGAAAGASRTVAASSWYNTGNAHFEMGNYGAAVEAYTEALRLDPADRNAKYNLELARRQMEAERPPPSGQPKQEPAPQPRKDDQPADQPRSGDGGQPEQGSPAEQRKQPGGGAPPQDPAAARENERDKAANAQPTQGKQRPGQLSREQALQILDALQNQELVEQRKRVRDRERRAVTGRDW